MKNTFKKRDVPVYYGYYNISTKNSFKKIERDCINQFFYAFAFGLR